MRVKKIDKSKIWKGVFTSWFWTLFAIITLKIVVFVLFFFLLRVLSPRVVVAAFISMSTISLAVFLCAEVIINIIMRAKSPDEVEHKKFIEIAKRMKERSGMWFMPRLYVLNIPIPNAMAYGWGFFGQYAVGITQELYDLLNEKELEGVVAHEFAHIKCKDVGVMSIIGLLTGGFSKISDLLLKGGTPLEKGPAAIVLGYFLKYTNKYVFGILRSAISQEREYTADALASLYTENPQGLINALSKLSARHSGERMTILDELMISHPKMEHRLDALRSYID